MFYLIAKQPSDIAASIAEAGWEMLLDTAPWLLFGLVLAGVLHAWVPTGSIARWLGKPGIGASVRAALIGTPIPLCSCSVLPAAITLRKRGASPGATVSFLVSTPENGLDSIAVSYALLGPFMTVVRPVTAILSAVSVGWMADVVAARSDTPEPDAAGDQPQADRSCCDTNAVSGCCDTEAASPAVPASGEDCCKGETPVQSCCDTADTCCESSAVDSNANWLDRLGAGLRYAFGDLIDDLKLWLLVGIALAAIVAGLVPPDLLAEWGHGPLAMLVMLLIGIPMYICATASTPLAAAMLLAGVSPGTVLVFLLAGPATNLGGFAIIRNLLGTPVAAAYILGISVTTIALGLATDAIAGAWGLNIRAQVSAAHQMLPMWVSLLSLFVLAVMAIKPVRNWIFGLFARSFRGQPAEA